MIKETIEAEKYLFDQGLEYDYDKEKELFYCEIFDRSNNLIDKIEGVDLVDLVRGVKKREEKFSDIRHKTPIFSVFVLPQTKKNENKKNIKKN